MAKIGRSKIRKLGKQYVNWTIIGRHLEICGNRGKVLIFKSIGVICNIYHWVKRMDIPASEMNRPIRISGTVDGTIFITLTAMTQPEKLLGWGWHWGNFPLTSDVWFIRGLNQKPPQIRPWLTAFSATACRREDPTKPISIAAHVSPFSFLLTIAFSAVKASQA